MWKRTKLTLLSPILEPCSAVLASPTMKGDRIRWTVLKPESFLVQKYVNYYHFIVVEIYIR